MSSFLRRRPSSGRFGSARLGPPAPGTRRGGGGVAHWKQISQNTPRCSSQRTQLEFLECRRLWGPSRGTGSFAGFYWWRLTGFYRRSRDHGPFKRLCESVTPESSAGTNGHALPLKQPIRAQALPAVTEGRGH